jgi:EmrB/QacA subfamily drug resistance transporter
VRLPKGTRVIPFIVAFGFLLEGIDSTCITTAIPEMAVSLNVSPVSLNLAITSYVLSLAVFIPISGWVADRFGSRRVFCAAIIVFTLGSLACGLATSLPMLVAMRALQGIGGAMMTPVGRLILLRTFSRQQLVTAMAYMSIPSLLGPTIGPLLGGVLTSYANWRWIFLINLPIGALGIYMTLRYVRDVEPPIRTRFDIGGFLLCGAALALLQFAIENIGRHVLPTWIVLAVAAAAAICMVLYIRYARVHTDPVLDLNLLRIRTFRVANVAGGLCRTAMNAAPFMLPLLLQVGFGRSPVESGTITLMLGLGAFTVKPVSAALLRWLGFSRLLTTNAVISGFAIAGFALFDADTPTWAMIAYVMAFGIFRTMQFTSINGLGYSEIPPEQLSRSVSLGGVAQQLTNGFGVSLSAAMLNLLAAPGEGLSIHDLRITFILMGVVSLASLPLFMQLKPADGAQVSGRVLDGIGR